MLTVGEKQPLARIIRHTVGIDQSVPCASLLLHTRVCVLTCSLAREMTCTALQERSIPLGGHAGPTAAMDALCA